ncbi:MAG: hypothetical protein WA364_02775 [Candidatus Nitrosopolaris sp.]
MNTKVGAVFSIMTITAVVLLFAASPVITHDAIAAIIVNPPATIVNPCPLGTIPETTTTGTVCLLIPGGDYGYGTGFGPHYWYHPWHHHLY